MNRHIISLDDEVLDNDDNVITIENEQLEATKRDILNKELKIFIKASLQLLEHRDNAISTFSRFNSSFYGLLNSGK